MRFIEWFVSCWVFEIDRVAVESKGDGVSFFNQCFEMRGGNMIVIVIGATAVAALFIEFATSVGIFAALSEGVENGDAVCRERDRSHQG